MYLRRIFTTVELGPGPFLLSTSIVAVVAFAASFIPAWRASALSPMVAMRNQPESMWQAARLIVRRAMRDLSAGEERDVVPLGTLIGEFAGALRRTMSFPQALQEALAMLRERTGAQSIMLLETTPGEDYRGDGCVLPAHGLVLNRLRHYPHPLTLTSADFETWVRWAGEFRPEHTAEIEGLQRTGVRVVVPLRAKHEIVGVVLLGPPAGRESFSPSEKALLGSSAEVFALLIENARLNERALEQEKVRRDLALAAEVQRRLLPVNPPRSGIATLAAFTLPARTVGGDYYDFLDLPDGQVGIAVADIAGKGIAAALLMSVVQASLRVIAGEGALRVSELAAKMNRFLYASAAGTNKYATFFYAQLDPRGRSLRYVNAGHNPPFLVRRSGERVDVTELSTGGTVLGLFPDVAYEDVQIELCPGDLLVAYTDGVTEALNPMAEEFGEERLKGLLCEAAGLPAEDVSATLAASMREWIGPAEQYDDLTCVVIAINAP
jgi:sigma-B regulation protein RsbU (phosphoserine phosphatase)